MVMVMVVWCAHLLVLALSDVVVGQQRRVGVEEETLDEGRVELNAGPEQGAGKVDRVRGRDEPPVQHLVEELVLVEESHLQHERTLVDGLSVIGGPTLELL
jgi:hypothetical protein